MELPKDKTIVFFDGVCNFCNDTVNFAIKRDKKNIFMFAPLQSKAGQDFLLKNNLLQKDFDSVLAYKEGKIYKKSNASLLIVRHLSFPWPLLYFFKVIPLFVRDFFYELFAKNRYRFFGKKESCMIPTSEIKAKFLD